MRRANPAPIGARRGGTVGRSAGVALAWLAAAGCGVACLVGNDPRSGTEALVASAREFAVGLGAGAVATLLGAGRARWAGEAALGVLAMVALLAGLVSGLLWQAPWVVANRLTVENFLEVRRLAWLVVLPLGVPAAPFGIFLGGAIGLVAGVLVALARRRPRLAAGLALGLLLVGGAPPVQARAERRFADLLLNWPQHGGQRSVSTLIRLELAAVEGAVIGGACGATLAATALWLVRRREPAPGPPAPPAAG